MLAYLNTPTKFDDPKGPRYTSLFFSFPHNASFSASTCLQQSEEEFLQRNPVWWNIGTRKWNMKSIGDHVESCSLQWITSCDQNNYPGKEQAQPLVIWGWLLWFTSFVAWKVISSFILSIQIWVKDISYDFIFKVNVMNILFLFIWSCQ